MPILRVIAHLRSPVFASDPIHLDGALAWASPDRPTAELPADARVEDIVVPRLPLWRLGWGRHHILACSAWLLPPEAQITPSFRGGYLVDTPAASWLAIARREPLKKFLRRVVAIGSYEGGEVERWQIDTLPDASGLDVLIRGGRAARHIPLDWCISSERQARGRVLPPYWHRAGSVAIVPAGARVELRPEIRDRAINAERPKDHPVPRPGDWVPIRVAAAVLGHPIERLLERRDLQREERRKKGKPKWYVRLPEEDGDGD